MTESIAIETHKLTKIFGTTTIVYRLSLHIPRGAIAGLLGPNGAGKSTTIKMLTGRLKPTSGEARVLGYNPWKQRHELMERVGYLPERPAYYPEMTAIKFLTFMGRLHGFSRSEAIKRAREALDLAGIGRIERRLLGKMSSGQKQRLGFASALLHDPELLILDEPTANLDPQGRIYMMNLITDLVKEGKTILVSSHILSEIERVCNWVGIMTEGHILDAGRIHDLVKGVYDTEYLIQCSDVAGMKGFVEGLEYVVSVKQEEENLYVKVHEHALERLWKEVPEFCGENKIQLHVFKPVKDALEKLFVDLVGASDEAE